MTPLPFQIRRTDAEIHGTCMYRFELIDVKRGNMVLCVARQESNTPPKWLVNRWKQEMTRAAKAEATP